MEPIQLKSINTQTEGEKEPDGLTYTPMEQDLLDKIGVVHERGNQMQYDKFAALKAKQDELKTYCDHLQAKFQRKKRTAKERNHAFKDEITGLKKQLADALRQSSTFNEQLSQLQRQNAQLIDPHGFVTKQQQSVDDPYDVIKTAHHQAHFSKTSGFSSSNLENLKPTTAKRRQTNIQPNELLCNVSQFGATSSIKRLLAADPSDEEGSLSSPIQKVTKNIALAKQQKSESVKDTHFLSSTAATGTIKQGDTTMNILNKTAGIGGADETMIALDPLTSRVKLFSKFVNTNKEQQQQSFNGTGPNRA